MSYPTGTNWHECGTLLYDLSLFTSVTFAWMKADFHSQSKFSLKQNHEETNWKCAFPFGCDYAISLANVVYEHSQTGQIFVLIVWEVKKVETKKVVRSLSPHVLEKGCWVIWKTSSFAALFNCPRYVCLRRQEIAALLCTLIARTTGKIEGKNTSRSNVISHFDNHQLIMQDKFFRSLLDFILYDKCQIRMNC